MEREGGEPFSWRISKSAPYVLDYSAYRTERGGGATEWLIQEITTVYNDK